MFDLFHQSLKLWYKFKSRIDISTYSSLSKSPSSIINKRIGLNGKWNTNELLKTRNDVYCFAVVNRMAVWTFRWSIDSDVSNMTVAASRLDECVQSEVHQGHITNDWMDMPEKSRVRQKSGSTFPHVFTLLRFIYWLTFENATIAFIPLWKMVGWVLLSLMDID